MACGGNEQDRSSIRGWGCDATGVCRNRFARGFLVRAGSHAVDPARTNHHPLSRAAHLAAKRSHRRSPAYFFASARRSKTRSLRACWVHKPSRNGISFCDLPPSHFASGAFGREAISFPSSARRSKTRSLRDLFGAQALAKRTYPFASGAFGREAISSAKPRVLPLFRPQEQNKIASGLLGAQALAKRHLISRDVAGPGLVPGSNPLGHPLHRLLRRGASSQ